MKKKLYAVGSLILGVLLVAVFSLTPYHKGYATVSGTNTLINFEYTNTNGSSAMGTWSRPSISTDGNLVVFQSDSTDLVSTDTNFGVADIALRNMQTSSTQLVNVSSSGVQANAVSNYPHISGNGRYVVFSSKGSNLASWTGSFAGTYNVYMRNISAGTTQLISTNSSGDISRYTNFASGVSNDGRFVLFVSDDPSLNSSSSTDLQVYLKDLVKGTTQLISQSSSGSVGNSSSPKATMSCDGGLIAFDSDASNLVAGDTNGMGDVFVSNLVNGQVITDITQSGNGNSNNGTPNISCNGDYIAFDSEASNLVTGDTNGYMDGFVYDRDNGMIDRVNVSSSGSQTTQSGMADTPSVSDNGQFVVFATSSTDITSASMSSHFQVLMRDREAGTTEILSQTTSGNGANNDSDPPTIASNGKSAAYMSRASNLVPTHLNSTYNYYLSGI